MRRDADYWIDQLHLTPHPEGGYYAQTHRSPEWIGAEYLPERFGTPRVISTAILYLLKGDQFSALHRLKSDEMWHFYAGSPLTLSLIDEEGTLSSILLGNTPLQGESFQAVVRAGCWFGAKVQDPASYALVGCTVAPGFEYEDFELGTREYLTGAFPQHRTLILSLTRGKDGEAVKR